ncbi:MAG: hypothetical protein AAF604_06915 [Acidobacteriota bacterium]
MAHKTFVNRTDLDLAVTVFTRQGEDPRNSGPTLFIDVLAQAEKRIEYGDAENPFLNGVSLAWRNAGSTANQGRLVTVRGSAWDDTLNTNDTLVIEAVENPAVVGENRGG